MRSGWLSLVATTLRLDKAVFMDSYENGLTVIGSSF